MDYQHPQWHSQFAKKLAAGRCELSICDVAEAGGRRLDAKCDVDKRVGDTAYQKGDAVQPPSEPVAFDTLPKRDCNGNV